MYNKSMTNIVFHTTLFGTANSLTPSGQIEKGLLPFSEKVQSDYFFLMICSIYPFMYSAHEYCDINSPVYLLMVFSSFFRIR